MPKFIDAFKTFDGKIFEDETKADNYTLNATREILDTHLAGKLPHLTRSQQYEVIMALLPDDITAAGNLFSRITEILTYGD